MLHLSIKAQECGFASPQDIDQGEPSDASPFDGDALAVSQEMLLLALQEWPNSEAAYFGREANHAAVTPQGRAAAMRRVREDTLAARAKAAMELGAAATLSSGPTGDARPLPPYRTFESMLRSSLGVGDFLAQLRASRAPLDTDVEARQALAHGGQIQRLPRAYGSFMLFKRLVADEDGSGTLGKNPIFPGNIQVARAAALRRKQQQQLRRRGTAMHDDVPLSESALASGHESCTGAENDFEEIGIDDVDEAMALSLQKAGWRSAVRRKRPLDHDSWPARGVAFNSWESDS